MSNVGDAAQMESKGIGTFKKARATICKHCPACRQARRNPDSVVGRLLHHPWHSNNCPAWKAYNEVYGDYQDT